MRLNKEDKIQHEIVMWFSQTYPGLRGRLWEVNNDTYNAKHAMKRRAMGMIAGASDLQMFYAKKYAAIEIKAPGTSHDLQRIKSQLDYGADTILNGGYFIMSEKIEVIKAFITSILEDNVWDVEELQNKSIRHINKLIEEAEKKGVKTVKF